MDNRDAILMYVLYVDDRNDDKATHKIATNMLQKFQYI